MRRDDRPLLLLLILLIAAIALSGCRTTAARGIEIPSFDIMAPSMVPDGLISAPATANDLYTNSVCYEHAMYSWQDYAHALEDYILQLKSLLAH